MPTSAVAPITIDIRTTTVTPWPRSRKVRPVAQASAANTKNCQGRRPSAGPSNGGRQTESGEPAPAGPLDTLVEVAELIVETLIELRIRGGGSVDRRLVVIARPANGSEADNDRAAGAEQIREQPREPVEALVHGRAQEL